MESVIQCFQCYGYGHWKDKCEKSRKCIVCSEDVHGQCVKKKKCINCGEEHKANDKECEVYRKYEEMNKMKALEGMTQYEARRRVIERHERNSEEEGKNASIEERVQTKYGQQREEMKINEELTQRGTIPKIIQIQKVQGRKWSTVVKGTKERREDEREIGIKSNKNTEEVAMKNKGIGM